MHLFALRHQRKARERIGVLAANQPADAANPGVRDHQPCAVARIPGKLLKERRHQLAMVHQNASVIADQQVAVPQSADAGRVALAEAQGNEHLRARCGLADAGDLRAIGKDRGGGEAFEMLMCPDRRMQRRPERKARNEAFRKHHQLGTIAGGLIDPASCFLGGSGGIEPDRGSVRRGGLEAVSTVHLDLLCTQAIGWQPLGGCTARRFQDTDLEPMPPV